MFFGLPEREVGKRGEKKGREAKGKFPGSKGGDNGQLIQFKRFPRKAVYETMR